MNRAAENASDRTTTEDGHGRLLEETQRRVVELEAAVARLQELQDQFEDLLLAVSHDLRNPLTVIVGHAQLLQRMHGRVGMNDQERNLETIVAMARRMNMMVQDLLDCARLQTGRLQSCRQPIDLAQFFHSLLMRVSISLEIKRVKLAVAADTPPVMADPDHLERIVVNLLSNALKYSTAGTQVELRVNSRGPDAVVEVQDEGPGFSPEDLPHVFERFRRPRASTTKDSVGLGLYITKMLVEAQDGHIGVVSELGRGATFSFTLPGA